MSKDIKTIIYGAILLIVLMLGLWGGWKIASGYYEPEIKRLNDALDKAKVRNDKDTTVFLSTLKSLAEGNQFEGVGRLK